MSHKLYDKYYGLLFLLLLFVLILSSCQTQSPDFQVIQTGQVETQEIITVQVDNCGGLFTKPYTYRSPYIGGAVGVENLRPNGGEPFTSIRKQIWSMYANQAEKLRLIVPAATQREFTLIITKIDYRGIVRGQIIEKNKIIPTQDAIFFYPFIESIILNDYQDIPCSVDEK